VVGMDVRQQRGLEIAKQKQSIRKTEGGWLVKSQSGAGYYKVSELFECNCPDSLKRGVLCKHAYAARFFLKVEIDTPQGIKTVEKRISYPQAWGAYRQAQNAEVKLFDQLVSDLVEGVEEPEQQRGRPRVSLKQGLFCAIQKVYSQLSSRRAFSLYENAEQRNQIEKAPSYNAINVFLNRKDITPILHELLTLTALPLKAVESNFAVDSSGFRTRCFGQYAEEKYGLGREHKWLKAHAIVGTKTNCITSAIVGEENSADSPNFPVLVKATANGGFEVKQVVADKAYSSAENHNVVAELGGQAYIPFKSNATASVHGSKYRLWKKAFLYYSLHSEEFYEIYHKRSNIESTFAAVKRKFGETLKSKNPKAQENELLCKLVAYNITVLIQSMFELGVQPDFSAHKSGNMLIKEGDSKD